MLGPQDLGGSHHPDHRLGCLILDLLRWACPLAGLRSALPWVSSVRPPPCPHTLCSCGLPRHVLFSSFPSFLPSPCLPSLHRLGASGLLLLLLTFLFLSTGHPGPMPPHGMRGPPPLMPPHGYTGPPRPPPYGYQRGPLPPPRPTPRPPVPPRGPLRGPLPQ